MTDNSLDQRLQDKARADGRMFASSIGDLAQVLAGQAADSAVLLGTGDALVDACRQVFRAAGITPAVSASAADAPIQRLESLARQAGAAWRVVALTGRDWWRDGAMPLLAFRKDGAPVALLPAARGDGLWLWDPAAGTRVRLDARQAAGLETQAFVFYRPLPDERITLWSLARFALRGSGRDIARLLLLGALGGVLGLGVPVATGALINTVIPAGGPGRLGQFILLLLTATLGVSAFELTRAIALLRVDARAAIGVQAAVMQRVLRLPAPFFRTYAAGDLTQRIFGATQILHSISESAQSALISWIFSLASFAFLFTIDWRLGLLVALLAGIAMAAAVGINLLRLRLERRMIAVQGDLASRVFQLLTGMAKLRANGAEKRAFALWATRFAQQKTLSFGVQRLGDRLEVFNAGYVVLASLCLFAAVEAAAPLSTGAFAAFNAAFSQFFAATLAMTMALTNALSAAPLYERLRPLLQAMPEPNRVQAAPRPFTGAIDISHVSFRYSADGPLILDDVSISIRPGEFVAIVGASGSGKSTLFRLLLGFERPQGGAIYYDGQDLAGLDLGAVRRQLGVVLQNGKLIPGPLSSNIIGASTRLTVDDAWEAARLAGLDQDIRAMPMGMHTVIAEGAGVISGGQKQRLMIARALAGRPRILLFDEATSALDNTTQAIVTRSVRELRATRVVIAHRLSTIIEADRIFVMDQGRLVENGSYADLIAQGGVFGDLARRQMM
ncbi:NHLP bacteriocin export ABC transporter permease/ATPase subunit [Nitrospirillum amazonense]|uniref:NHLP bacteriocin export ABC transporter permease/ATPase subunit n=1 Tax=Nitrospirillum amazonense TaxID=28077 RepID=UPI00241229A2|nr:NHLP bacteriocin export ABC transporter permease/ATPase subunit [Nitrospirillum amazonense]MDG3439605.1 NHLP bacteriocin export ABC transporter permease/ATPase subunit [Nitrospirillum amazonense]